ncbi:hypothetical protein [Sulfurimonas diazotrophicus]|uniref:Uncharacterized protein n=1 Tax=Sulfurimonas diazotrophicus TaxID=3131939 RepID=A0ABZ3HCG2_9BACT
MESIVAVTVFYLLLEGFEIAWQKAPTMLEMLIRIRRRYDRSIFYFFLLHPTYYFAIWLILETRMALPAVMLLFIKTVDIATKIVLMQQVFEKREVSAPLQEMLIMPLGRWMPYAGYAVYPPLVLWAIL